MHHPCTRAVDLRQAGQYSAIAIFEAQFLRLREGWRPERTNQ
jgi:hypothetical protein